MIPEDGARSHEADSTIPPPEDTPGIVEPLTVTDKFVGIFSEPSPTYENVRQTGAQKSDWVVPLLALAVIVAAGTLLRLMNPEFMAEMKQQQVDAMQERVRSGAMTQEQANQALEQIEKFSGLQAIIGPFGAAIGQVIVFFLLSAVYWVITRYVFKGAATFALTLSIVGLAQYIGVIDQIVSIILMYATDKPMANLSPALFMKTDMHSIKNASFRILVNLNPITVWSYYVLGLGFHKVAGLGKVKAMALVFGLWILWVLLSTFLFKFIPGMG